MWRLSDLTTAQGERVADLFSSQWAASPKGWLDLVMDLLSDATNLPDLGAWRSDQIHDRRYLALVDAASGELQLVRPTRMADGVRYALALRRICRRKLQRHRIHQPQGWTEWLALTGGQCSCLDPQFHTHSCYVWASDDSGDAQEICYTLDAILPVAFSTRSGTWCSHSGDEEVVFIAIDERTLGTTEWIPPVMLPEAQRQVLDGVDVESILGARFSTLMVPESTRDKYRGHWCDTVELMRDNSILYAYSDCSLAKTPAGPKLSYGWLFGGLADPSLSDAHCAPSWPSRESTEDDRYQLSQGDWGGGVVQGPAQDKTTYRGEAFGVLALLVRSVVLLGRSETPKSLRVWAFCDNEAVCNRFNLLHGEQEMGDCTGADPDLWALIFRLKDHLGGSFRLSWQRSHPELRKHRNAFHRHNWGNTWSDEVAELAMAALDDSGEGCALGDALTWGVRWGEDLVTNNIRRSLRQALMADMFHRYLRDTRGWAAEAISNFPGRRWLPKLALMSDVSNAVVMNKLLVGWLATLTVQAKRHRGVAPLDTTCRLCGLAPESNWHVLAECSHPTMTHIRTKLMSQIVDNVAQLPLPSHVQQLVSLNWLVAADGTLVDLQDDTALADVMRSWAPELADRIEAADLRHKLLWDSPQGKHSDDLRKWAFRGVLPAQWECVMQDMGVPLGVAKQALGAIEKVVCAVVPELWREFCSGVHDAEGKVRTKGALAVEIDRLFATWDGPVPQRLAQDVRKWTPKRQRQWAASVRRARRRRVSVQEPHQGVPPD